MGSGAGSLGKGEFSRGREERARFGDGENIRSFSGHFDCCLQQKEEEKTLDNLPSKIIKIYFLFTMGKTVGSTLYGMSLRNYL
jgi:hypothetical protein